MYTPITLDKVRNFRYGMKAISMIEKQLKINISKLDFNSLTMEDTATLVWAGLVHEDKDLTVDKVMDLIDEYSDLKTVIEVMGKAFNDAFGEAKNVKNS
jgi:hypothetical protein